MLRSYAYRRVPSAPTNTCTYDHARMLVVGYIAPSTTLFFLTGLGAMIVDDNVLIGAIGTRHNDDVGNEAFTRRSIVDVARIIMDTMMEWDNRLEGVTLSGQIKPSSMSHVNRNTNKGK
jgi:hypothetical protein